MPRRLPATKGGSLIPFVCLYLLFVAKRKWHAPLIRRSCRAWLRWPGWRIIASTTAIALEFYNGPWSAIAIYRRAREGGMSPYPGDHDWRLALEYYFDRRAIDRGLARDRRGSRRNIHRDMAASLVAFSDAGARTGILPLEHARIGNADLRPRALAVQLLQHPLCDSRYCSLAAFAAGAIVTLLSRRWQIPVAIAMAAIPLAVSTGGAPVCWKEARGQFLGATAVDSRSRSVSGRELPDRHRESSVLLRRSDRRSAPSRNSFARRPCMKAIGPVW